MGIDGFGPAKDAIAALADEIADRLVLRLAPEVTRLVANIDSPPAAELWTAGRVADHFGVDVSFVYRHADQLGCIRLGSGDCARLRFVPSVATACGANELGDTLPAQRPQRRRFRRGPQTAGDLQDKDLLLDFDREP